MLCAGPWSCAGSGRQPRLLFPPPQASRQSHYEFHRCLPLNSTQQTVPCTGAGTGPDHYLWVPHHDKQVEDNKCLASFSIHGLAVQAGPLAYQAVHSRARVVSTTPAYNTTQTATGLDTSASGHNRGGVCIQLPQQQWCVHSAPATTGAATAEPRHSYC